MCYVPLSLPAFLAFAIVSVTAHWNEFLWPLMVINSPRQPAAHRRPRRVHARPGRCAGLGVIAAGTLLVVAPLLIGFLLFQRRFVDSFVTSGINRRVHRCVLHVEIFRYRAAAGLAAAAAVPALAQAPTEIELFFPVPVDGQLARDMTTLIKEFSDSHPGIKATAVFTGSYDETLIKTRPP